MRLGILLCWIVVGWVAVTDLALAGDESLAILTIHNQQFDPNKLAIPSGVKVKIIVRNQDSMPVEFESYDLSREVVVPGHGEVAIFVGPVEQGTYQYFNDFNHDMQGAVEAKPAAKKGN